MAATSTVGADLSNLSYRSLDICNDTPDPLSLVEQISKLTIGRGEINLRRSVAHCSIPSQTSGVVEY